MSLVFLSYHLNKYPLIQKEDKIKLIYQALLGPHHLNMKLDKSQVLSSINQELTYCCSLYENLYEYIGPSFVRVNLHLYKKLGFDLNHLCDAFFKSSLYQGDFTFFKEQLNKYLNPDELLDYDYLPISHSNIYKTNYSPSYRVINSKFIDLNMKYQQIKNYLNSLNPKKIVCLEGRCASGKTTLAKLLESDYTIVDIDDFFLPLDLRSDERLNEVGGNIHYELVSKTLELLSRALDQNQETFTYPAYNCQTHSYYDKTIVLKDQVILVGVYSSHPYFRKYLSSIIYLYVDKQVQLARINERKLKEMFINKWIPLEENYFNSIDILSITDLIV